MGKERVKNKEGKNAHPTQKPVKLLEHIINIASKEGEKKASMFDKMGGSCKVTAAKVGLSTFTIPAHFCEGCKKMIIDTDVTK